ncbi:MAG: SpaA isopeptide-forming pilin-related protein [Peptoniphilaceae bacterium]|nr:SpaA isopeptide-forming pilin-related protein [Peptoniphilaceae bacterium]MDY6085833.1 SpaA isopeptide-forming pilin-related protein [Peptoniphilaceae bacterium]
MKKSEYRLRHQVLLLTLFVLALVFMNVGREGRAAEATFPVTFAPPKQVQGVSARTMTLWTVLPSDMVLGGETDGTGASNANADLRVFLAHFENKSASEISEILGRKPVVLSGNAADDFALSARLARGTYLALDEVTAGKAYRALMLFTVPSQTGEPLQSKLVVDEMPGTGILEKVDEAGEPLAGVGFELYFDVDHPLNETGELKLAPLVETAGSSAAGIAAGVSSTSYQASGKALSLVTDALGHIVVTNLPPGNYVFRETKPLPGYGLVEKDNQITIRAGETTTLRVVNAKGEGGFRFIKVSAGDHNPLAGAQFLLTRREGDQDVRVRVDGADVVLTSGADGRFAVEHLPYGTYALWEVKSPDGYEKLSDPIVFTVGDGTAEKLLMIEDTEVPPENPPVNPPETSTPPPPPSTPPSKPPTTPPSRPPHLPNTGDVLFLMLCLAGGMMMLIGAILVRDEKPKERA